MCASRIDHCPDSAQSSFLKATVQPTSVDSTVTGLAAIRLPTRRWTWRQLSIYRLEHTDTTKTFLKTILPSVETSDLQTHLRQSFSSRNFLPCSSGNFSTTSSLREAVSHRILYSNRPDTSLPVSLDSGRCKLPSLTLESSNLPG